MPQTEVRVPLTPKSVARLSQANQRIKQAQVDLANIAGVILEAMGAEGQIVNLNLEDGYAVLLVPGLHEVIQGQAEAIQDTDEDTYPDAGPAPFDEDSDPDSHRLD